MSVALQFDQDFAPCPGGQAALWADRRSSLIFLEGGWMSGKTWVCARSLLDAHLFNAFDAGGLPTGVPSLMVGPSQTMTMDLQLAAVEDAAKAMDIGAEYRSQIRLAGMGTRPLRSVCVFPGLAMNGVVSYMLIRTAAKPENITGYEVGAAWGDEVTRWKENPLEPKRDPLTQLYGRVRHPRARFLRTLLSYTNEGNATRVYEEARRGSPGTALYRARTRDNPRALAWMREQIAAKRLTLELQQQYFEGDAVNVRGTSVFSSFQDSPPIVTEDARLDLAGGPIALALDFNIAPGMHGLIGQHRGAEDMIDVVDEIHETGLTVPRLCELVAKRWAALPEPRPPLEVFGDTAGNQRNASTGKSHWETVQANLARLGVPHRFRVKIKHAPVADGVNACNAAFASLDGTARLRVHPRCEILREDLRKLGYDQWGQIDDSNPRRGHAAAAMRYFVEMVRPCRLVREDAVGRINVRPARAGSEAARW